MNLLLKNLRLKNFFNQQLLFNIIQNINSKKSLRTSTKLSLPGFSLIEIMVVVTLMGLLIGGGAVLLLGQLEEGKIKTARNQAYEIAKSLDLYKLQTGNYPTASEGLEVLVNPPRGQPLMNEMPIDPWGNPYNYAIPGTHNPKGFDVWSNGPKGTEGAESDIGNWRPEDNKKE